MARALSREPVLRTAIALIGVQLAYRAWATFGAYYHYDDFNFISRMLNEGVGIDVAGRQYSGHIMPGGMYMSWLLQRIGPYDYRLVASLLLVLQALAAGALLALLVRMFGVRWGIVPALAVYLFNPGNLPVAIWWAAGINQMPMQITLFLALYSHVAYLRSQHPWQAGATAAWMVAGLLFYEKTLLVFGALAIVTLAYYTEGRAKARIEQIWRRYRFALILYTALGAGYLLMYVHVGLTFSPARATNGALHGVLANMVLRAYIPALFGGPLHWWRLDQWALPTPGDLTVLVCLILAAIFIRELAVTRRRSLRALWFPGFFIASDVLLVVAGRASFVGSLISLDYRFQAELSAVTGIALACATMPIVDSPQPVQNVMQSEFLDHPARVAAVTAIISLLSLVSSTQYALHWQHSAPARQYFANLMADLQQSKTPLPLVDSTIPSNIMWGLAYPENTASHMLRQYSTEADYPSATTDTLYMLNSRGHVVPVVVPPVRSATKGPEKHCGYRVGPRGRTIPLDGPVAYGGWWLRVGYVSSGTSPVRVRMGRTVRALQVLPGLHAMYLKADSDFDRIRISGLGGDIQLCTNDVTVGRPTPARLGR